MPADLDQLWNDILNELRRETPDFKFHIWIEPLRLAGVRGTTLYIRAPDHVRTSVRERYVPLLRQAARRQFDRAATVEIVGAGWSDSEQPEPAAANEHEDRLNPKYPFEPHFEQGPQEGLDCLCRSN